MKSIWVMRHGDAPYINGERQISETGHQHIARMAQWFAGQLKERGETLESLFVSPVLRAQQTADTFESSLKNYMDMTWQRQTESLLAPEANAELTIPYVEQVAAGTTVLISHMPLVSNLWAAWLGGESQYFPTSAMGALLVDPEGDTQVAQKVLFQTPDDFES